MKSEISKEKIKKQNKKPKETIDTKKTVIDKKIIKEFTIFLLKKAKIYEEISFETILRKIPKSWKFTERDLIDTLEIILDQGKFSSIKMKMTANSLKYYSKSSKKDKLK